MFGAVRFGKVAEFPWTIHAVVTEVLRRYGYPYSLMFPITLVAKDLNLLRNFQPYDRFYQSVSTTDLSGCFPYMSDSLPDQRVVTRQTPIHIQFPG